MRIGEKLERGAWGRRREMLKGDGGGSLFPTPLGSPTRTKSKSLKGSLWGKVQHSRPRCANLTCPEFCYIFVCVLDFRHLLNYIYITADLSFPLFSIHLESMHFLVRRTGTETVPCGTPSWPRASVSGSARLSFSFWAFHSSIASHVSAETPAT
jgi:hypothetical protein